VLGIQPGATENAAAVEDLLNQLVARGVKPDVKRLFVIDGAKALRAAIHRVFGSQHPVQRCRNHKIRNVVERLPEEHPAAAASLREGLEECFTINRLGVAPSLHRCLATTPSDREPTVPSCYFAWHRWALFHSCCWGNGFSMRSFQFSGPCRP